MKLFLKILIIVLLGDIVLGFSMSYFVGNSEPNFLFKIIDEIISIPTNLWNRLAPEHGIYKTTTKVFWLIVVFNALIQTLIIFGIVKLFKIAKK